MSSRACQDCGTYMSLLETSHGGQTTFRKMECECGARFESEERVARRLPPAPARARRQAPAGVEQPPPTPASAGPLPSGGGFGGSLPEGSIRPESGQGSISSLLSTPDQTRARSNGGAIDYPGEFVVLWEQTGKRGVKAAALKAWKAVGRPSWVDVQEAWRAYLLSDRPVAGFIKDLSSWLNGRCHQQEWLPAAAPPLRNVSAVPPWKQAERDEEQRKRDERNREQAARERLKREMDEAVRKAGVG